jgi:hypothetical protein
LQANRGLHWYDRFSRVYDWLNDYPYQSVRREAIRHLAPLPGDTVFDLFCGTGVNFEYLLGRLEGQGTIIGVDGSVGMLEKALARVRRNAWDESQVQLLEKDLSIVTPGYLARLLPEGVIPKVLLTLGPAGLPGWESFWEALFAAVPAGTRFATMDVHCRKGTISAGVVNFFGAGDFRLDVSSHTPWEHLRDRCTGYREDRFFPFRLLNCSVVVASGAKDE